MPRRQGGLIRRRIATLALDVRSGKGVGKIYLHAVVDTFGSYAFGFLHFRLREPVLDVKIGAGKLEGWQRNRSPAALMRLMSAGFQPSQASCFRQSAQKVGGHAPRYPLIRTPAD